MSTATATRPESRPPDACGACGGRDAPSARNVAVREAARSLLSSRAPADHVVRTHNPDPPSIRLGPAPVPGCSPRGHRRRRRAVGVWTLVARVKELETATRGSTRSDRSRAARLVEDRDDLDLRRIGTMLELRDAAAAGGHALRATQSTHGGCGRGCGHLGRQLVRPGHRPPARARLRARAARHHARPTGKDLTPRARSAGAGRGAPQRRAGAVGVAATARPELNDHSMFPECLHDRHHHRTLGPASARPSLRLVYLHRRASCTSCRCATAPHRAVRCSRTTSAKRCSSRSRTPGRVEHRAHRRADARAPAASRSTSWKTVVQAAAEGGPITPKEHDFLAEHRHCGCARRSPGR